MFRRALLISAVVLFCAGIWLATSPSLQTAGREAVPGGAPVLENGRMLFFAGGCSSCHRSPGQDNPFELGGGMPISIAMGTFYPPNISPDREYGIGSWTPQQFLRALRAGVSPDGRHLYPLFPYTFYQRIRPADARDLFAFLLTLPAVHRKAPAHRLRFPFDLRRGIGFWKLLFLDGKEFEPDPSRGSRWNRGAYLVEALLHCAECHSPRNFLEAIPADRRFTGGTDPEHRVSSIPDITQTDRGLRTWSQEELVALLSAEFFTARYAPHGDRMAEVIEGTAHLPRSDIEAIAEYVLALPGTARIAGGHSIGSPPSAPGAAVTINIRLHRSWWEIDYDAPEPYRMLTTANEAHIPVGTPVVLQLTSDRPIGSFCIPGLIENQVVGRGGATVVRIFAEQPGIYRGQAECRGEPTLLFVAQPREKFEIWREQQLEPASAPDDPERERGLRVFLSTTCVMCHTVRGTGAGARSGPDLTHFARRHYLAAGALPRSTATLAAWISDPQGIKPGTLMPATKLSGDDLRALTAYVNGLR